MSADIILNLGDDALSNQFQLLFPDGIPSGGNTDEIALRMDQAFTMPTESIYKYDIDFKGTKLPKTGMKEETDKTLSFSVRIDQQWDVWDALEAWHRMVYDPETNVALNQALLRVPVHVQALDRNNSIIKEFKFKGCILHDLKPTDFDNASGDPVRAELTLLYSNRITD